jgi:hypothetical protein
MKGSLFIPKPTEAAQEVLGTDVQVLAVWGSPGSGKTPSVCALPSIWPIHKRNVVLLLCDMTAPMLPCICPLPIWNANDLSAVFWLRPISPILSSPELHHSQEDGLSDHHRHDEGREYVYLPALYSGAGVELIDHLRDVAPFVIIDCGSYIAYDVLSAVSILEADSVLRLVNCDLNRSAICQASSRLLQEQNGTRISNTRRHPT